MIYVLARDYGEFEAWVFMENRWREEDARPKLRRNEVDYVSRADDLRGKVIGGGGDTIILRGRFYERRDHQEILDSVAVAWRGVGRFSVVRNTLANLGERAESS